MRVFQIVVRGGGGEFPPVRGITNFTGGVIRWRESEEWFWQFEPFSKLKTVFRECWASIKIKINMTCVSKQYEIKTNMEQQLWLQLKMMFLLGYNLKIVV